jgi:hypothetical protein
MSSYWAGDLTCAVNHRGLRSRQNHRRRDRRPASQRVQRWQRGALQAIARTTAAVLENTRLAEQNRRSFERLATSTVPCGLNATLDLRPQRTRWRGLRFKSRGVAVIVFLRDGQNSRLWRAHYSQRARLCHSEIIITMIGVICTICPERGDSVTGQRRIRLGC